MPLLLCSGNPALHLCVVHGQQEMYDFLVEYCAASDRVVNLHGHTPLVLAAVLGKVNMVQVCVGQQPMLSTNHMVTARRQFVLLSRASRHKGMHTEACTTVTCCTCVHLDVDNDLLMHVVPNRDILTTCVICPACSQHIYNKRRRAFYTFGRVSAVADS